jgi:phytoene dehydrogenase-like protein
MKEPEYDAIIVGAGHNGLVTAYYLAKDGLSVLVLERIERVGGGIGTEELYPGFHVPYCAYICHMLHG